MAMQPKTFTELLTLSKHEINHKIIISHFHEIIKLHFPNQIHIQIYTDASKSEHGVGFLVIHKVT